MRIYNPWKLAAILIITISLAACEHETFLSSDNETPPATLEKIAGSSLHRVILSKQAAVKIELQTMPVREVQKQKIVPYSSIIYDPNGQAWVYTNIGTLTFIRAPVRIDSIHGDDVLLLDGPNTNTQIVTVGASELYGAEFLENIEP